MERLLREGARRPVLALLRSRPLRRPVRARGHRLPRGLRALDRAAQPPVLPRPAVDGLDRGRLARLRHPSRRRRRRRSTSSCATATLAWRGTSSSTEGAGARRCRPVGAGSSGTGAVAGASPAPGRPAAAGHGAEARCPTAATGQRCGSASSARAATRPRCCCRTSRSDPGATLATVATTRSLSAVNAQRKFGFERPRPMPTTVLDDPAIDAVFVVTRHHSHADFVCRALEDGKAVFVEKPLRSLERRSTASSTSSSAPATTGSWSASTAASPRCSPACRQRFGPVGGPVSARYLVNAGRMAHRQLVPRRGPRGVAVPRRGRPLHRHRELVDRARPGRGDRPADPERGRPARHAPLRRRLAGDDHLQHRRRPARSQGDPRRLRRRPQRPPGQLLPGHGVEPRWPRDVKRSHRPGQGPAGRARRLPRGGPARRRHADRPRLARRDHPGATIAVGESLVSGGRWLHEPVCPVVRPAASAGCPRSEVGSRVGDRVRQVRWAQRQVHPGDGRPTRAGLLTPGCSSAARTGRPGAGPAGGRAPARRRRRPAARR